MVGQPLLFSFFVQPMSISRDHLVCWRSFSEKFEADLLCWSIEFILLIPFTDLPKVTSLSSFSNLSRRTCPSSSTDLSRRTSPSSSIDLSRATKSGSSINLSRRIHSSSSSNLSRDDQVELFHRIIKEDQPELFHQPVKRDQPGSSSLKVDYLLVARAIHYHHNVILDDVSSSHVFLLLSSWICSNMHVSLSEWPFRVTGCPFRPCRLTFPIWLCPFVFQSYFVELSNLSSVLLSSLLFFFFFLIFL